MSYSVTKDGVCAKHLCVIDEVNKTVSTTEGGLVFDFGELFGWSFKTGWTCTFKTGSRCAFNTGSHCTFKTSHKCMFNTINDCTFKTGHGCTFKTLSDCTFNVGESCAFKTGFSCVFNTESFCTFSSESFCTFNTESCCTFDTGSNCTFKTGENCFVIRRDTNECFKLLSGVTTRLMESGYQVKTSEYVKQHVQSAEGLEIIISNDEYMVLTNHPT